jgi:curved DNA-binding protein
MTSSASGYQPGQDFRPPPNWDTGFEFSGRGFSGAEAADFSDFFSELFGRMGGGGAQAHGNDHHARILLDSRTAFTGATRQISLRVPKVDANGRVALDTRTLNVKIPKGIREGQIIRLAARAQAAWAMQSPATCCSKCSSVRTRAIARTAATCASRFRSRRGKPRSVRSCRSRRPTARSTCAFPAARKAAAAARARQGHPGDPPGDLYLEIQVVLPERPRRRRASSTKPWRGISLRSARRRKRMSHER